MSNKVYAENTMVIGKGIFAGGSNCLIVGQNIESDEDDVIVFGVDGHEF